MQAAMPAASPAAPGAEVEPVAYSTEANLRHALSACEASAERIRLILVNHLEEPERSAFWEAIALRNLARAALSDALSPPTTDAIKAQARREALEEAERSIKRLKGTLSYIAAQAKAGYPTALSVIRANAESALDDEWQKTVSEAQALLSKKVDDQ
jgi:hypothetical protein